MFGIGLRAAFLKVKKIKQMENVTMKFRDAPVGARFKYPESDKVWVKINSYPKGLFTSGDGLICSWNGNIEGRQEFRSFVDEALGIDFDTQIELV